MEMLCTSWPPIRIHSSAEVKQRHDIFGICKGRSPQDQRISIVKKVEGNNMWAFVHVTAMARIFVGSVHIQNFITQNLTDCLRKKKVERALFSWIECELKRDDVNWVNYVVFRHTVQQVAEVKLIKQKIVAFTLIKLPSTNFAFSAGAATSCLFCLAFVYVNRFAHYGIEVNLWKRS